MITLLAGDLDAALDEVANKSVGAAEEMAKKRMKGIVGIVHELIAAWDKLMITVSRSGVLEAVGNSFKKITSALEQLSASNPHLLEMGTYAAMAVIALAPLGAVLSGIAGIANMLLGAVAIFGSIPVLIAAGVLLAAAAIWYFWDDIKEAGSAIGDAISKWATESVEALGRMVDYFANLGSEIGSAIAETAVDLFDAGAQLLQSLWDGMKSKFSAMVSWASGIPSRIGGAIKGALGFGGDGGGSTGNLPARSRGGHVSRGRSYLVGERRPEIFTPGSSGYVHSRVPEGGKGQAITLSPVFNITGASDPEDLARKVERILSRLMQRGLHGIHADAGAAVW